MSNDIHEQLGRARAFAGRKGSVAADRLREGTVLARERIEGAREHAADAYASARDKTYRTANAANRILAEHPLAVMAGAVAAGAIISLFFPRGRAVARAIPGQVGALGTRALAAARSAKDAIEQSELAGTVKAKAGEAAETVRARAGEAAEVARERATTAASAARAALVEADIPGTVKARASEAAEAARDAIERARLTEKAAKLAGSAATRAGDALIAVGKRLPRD